jgi:hypothetical protein
MLARQDRNPMNCRPALDWEADNTFNPEMAADVPPEFISCRGQPIVAPPGRFDENNSSLFVHLVFEEPES